MFTHEELSTIRGRAEEMARPQGTSPLWQRAYEALADASDHLAAMIKRTETGDEAPGDIGD